ncbi:MAG: tetratricopeptide repeat protein [Candidatus Sericytochromatia bacterium]|nr:tetratricopeptide repeat protein [Candidatus Sericytochromatia bacterium]
MTARLQEALREQDWDEAIATFAALDAAHPDPEAQLVLWGELLEELSRHGLAWGDWQDRWPGGEAALEGAVYFLVRGVQALSEGAFDRAGFFLARAAESCPGSHVPVAYLGVLHEALGCPSEALAHYMRCLAREPGLFSVLNAAGNLYHELGFYDEACELYRQALPLLAEAANRAVVLGNMGNSLRALGQFEAAIEAYSEASRLVPAHPRAPLSLAETLLEARRPEEAVATLEAALRDSGYDEWPTDLRAQLHAILARAFSQLGNHAAAAANWWQHLAGDLSDEGREGVRAMLKALYAWAVTSPGDGACERLLARMNRRLGYLEAALLHAKRAVKIAPHAHEAFQELGAGLLLVGKDNVAHEALDEAAAIAPGSAEVQALRAMAVWREDPDVAEAALLEACRLEPTEALHRCDLGWLRTVAGDQQGAEQAFVEALLLWDRAPVLLGTHGPIGQRGCYVDVLDAVFEGPASFEERLNGGTFAVLAGRLDVGQQLLQRCLAERPDSAEATRNHAWLLSQQGSATEACAWWQRAAKLSPEDRISRFFWLRARASQGSTEKEAVLRELPRRREQDADDPLLTLLEGKLREPTAEALACYGELISQRPGTYSTWYWLGQCHFHRKEPDLARPALERCVGLNPRFVPGRQLLASCYAQLGDEARSAYHRGQCHWQAGHLHRARTNLSAAQALDPAMPRLAEELAALDRQVALWTAPELAEVLGRLASAPYRSG